MKMKGQLSINPKSKTKVLIALTIIVILSSGWLPTIYAAAPAASWGASNGNANNWSWSSQISIGTNNVNQLGVRWVFPIPGAPLQWAGNDGVIVTPIIVHGIAYFITNWQRVYAVDIRDGKTIWFKDLPIPANYTKTYPAWGNSPVLKGHYHGTSLAYTESPNVLGGEPLFWIASNNFHVFALDANTGDVKVNLEVLSPGYAGKIPGNYGNYSIITPALVIDPTRAKMVVGVASSSRLDSARGFVVGYDISKNPPTFLWRQFLMPPQDGTDPNWSLKSVQNMSYAYIFNGTAAIDLKVLPSSQLSSILTNDWGNCGFNGRYSACGVGISWGGSWIADNQTGIAYFATNQPTPFASPNRPGPNLWSDSILAVDMTTGKLIWGFQTNAHDLWDWDCSWAQSLETVPINRQLTKIVIKNCKNGYLYGLDAATGKMYWYFTPPQKDLPRSKYSYQYDPRNNTQMTKPWANYPDTGPFVSSPSFSGMFESDHAYDPKLNTVYIVGYLSPGVQKYLAPDAPGSLRGSNNGYTSAGLTPYQGPTNESVYAIDGSTGKIRWSYFIPNLGFRGGVTATNGLLIVPGVDGAIRYFDGKTGTLLNTFFLGAQTVVAPAVASDANGDTKIVFPANGAVASKAAFETFNAIPGVMLAVGLPAVVQTATVSTSVVTSIQTIAGPSTGIDPSTFYATLGVAVVFLIATGVLALRRRKPVP